MYYYIKRISGRCRFLLQAEEKQNHDSFKRMKVEKTDQHVARCSKRKNEILFNPAVISDLLADQHDNNLDDGRDVNSENLENIEQRDDCGSSDDDNAISTHAVVANTKTVPHSSNSNTSNTHATSSNTPIFTMQLSEDKAHVPTQAFNG